MKGRVTGKEKRTTDAKKDITIAREVAKPLRMLSEYLITMAVTSPPKEMIRLPSPRAVFRYDRYADFENVP